MSADIPGTDTIPVTRMVETTALTHNVMGTFDEVVQNLVALGWEVIEELPSRTALTHPLISGTTRYITK